MRRKLLVSVLYIHLIGLAYAAIDTENAQYQERINLHVGQTQYISGEVIHYKAYCFTQDNSTSNFLSKVLYVQLVNNNNKPVLNQVLKVENNQASANISIPDTLKTGTYMLKAYTNWMKNFSADHHFSIPVYIYNQYDKLDNVELLEYPCTPQFYIQGGKLIANVPALLYLKIPMVNGAKISGRVMEKKSKQEVFRFQTNAYGEAKLEFIPELSSNYELELVDEAQNIITYPMPSVQSSGIQINPVSYSNDSICVVVKQGNYTGAKVRFRADEDNTRIIDRTLVTSMEEQRICFTITPDSYSEIILTVVDEHDVELARQAVVLNPELQKRCSLVKQAATNSTVEVQLKLNDISILHKTGLSVDIHKIPIYDTVKVLHSSVVTNSHFAYHPIQAGLYSVYPRCFPASENGNDLSLNSYPVEDLGMLLTGWVFDAESNPIADVDVILAIKDTTGSILLSKTDSAGKFCMLVNEPHDIPGQFIINQGDKPYPGEYTLKFEDKFYYNSDNRSEIDKLIQKKGISFTSYLRDEAQRLLIQRAFDNMYKEGKAEASELNKEGPFYGEPTYVVYPDDYIELNDFKEIVLEILPSVRYKYTNGSTTMSVFDINNYSRSDNPIVLLDGMPVDNLAELNHLSSKDINRIEVQTELRAIGNFLYKGLVAVYTSPEYRKKMVKKKVSSDYIIQGYDNNTYNSKSANTIVSKAGNVPNFKNQLYWAPMLTMDSTELTKIDFQTSDEEGFYKIDIRAYTEKGYPIIITETIKITAHD